MKIKEIIDSRLSSMQKSLTPNPVFAQSHKQVLELVDSYWNSKFRERPYDSRGFRKPFINVVRVPTFVSAKATDIDTKNIRIYSDEGQNYRKSYIFNKELKFYFKENGFDAILNLVTYNRPKYGHVVVKKVKDKITVVPIANMLMVGDNEKMSRPFVEKHDMTFDEFDEMNWDNKEKVKKLYETAKKEKICVYEISGKVSDNKNNYNVVAGLEYGDPIFCVSQDLDDVYRELKWEDVPGRALGRGNVEEQFEAQIAMNENEYLFRLGLQWTSKHLWQTRDVQAARNLLSEALNGDVITVNDEFKPIQMEERNLSAFSYADNKWRTQSQESTFSSDIMRGGNVQKGTTATQSVLQAQQSGGYYNLKRQDAGIFWKSIIEDWILPDFLKKNNKEHKIHIMKLLGDDNGSQKFFETFLAEEVNRKVIEFMSKGKILMGDELELVKALAAEELKTKDIVIDKDFYDFKYSVDVVVTGEQVDLAQRATALQTAFQVVGSNPQILQDPVARRTYFKLLEATGVNPAEIYDETIPSFQNTVQGLAAKQGGSISKPAAPAVPAMTSSPVAVG